MRSALSGRSRSATPKAPFSPARPARERDTFTYPSNFGATRSARSLAFLAIALFTTFVVLQI